MIPEFNIMFDYLDWCKLKGITEIKETQNRDLIRQFSKETNTPINGLALGLMDGKLFKSSEAKNEQYNEQ